MSEQIKTLHIKNFRSLADISIETENLNVLFGPNGSGKSTFLDTMWFIRDCSKRGVTTAASERSHGIGLLFDRAPKESNIVITLETDWAEYTVEFDFSSGRIEPYPYERLYSKRRKKDLLHRIFGTEKASFFSSNLNDYVESKLSEPELLTLNRYIAFNDEVTEASEIEKIVFFIKRYATREANLYALKKHGSESSFHVRLWDRCENLWSVLRNLHDKRELDERYDTIMRFMRKAFPTFDGLVFEQTGVDSVYAFFREKDHKDPILASGVSDGHLQMLIHLASLFSEGRYRHSTHLWDEPEVSLHPWAISILAEAIKEASSEWNNQIFIATHSPVLISQFDPHNIIATTIKDGRTVLKRVSEMEEIKDLLEDYAAGSLYMANVIAPQGQDHLKE